MHKKRALHLALVLSCCLVLIACDKVPMPTSDSTPPSLTWTVKNQTANTSSTISGSGRVTAQGKDTLYITLRANDPEGVSYIVLSGGYQKYCTGSDSTAQTGQGDFATQLHSLSPDASNQVSTAAIETMTLKADTVCSSGYTWDSTLVTLHGLARNYFSGETRGSLSITFTP